MYKDRKDAGQKLVQRLRQYENTNAIVLAVPRGGIVLGYEIATALNLPLDVVLAKKLVHPLHREYAIGGISLDHLDISDAAGVDRLYIQEETKNVRKLLRKRQNSYYGDRSPNNLEDRMVIIVDDGIATGNTLMACVKLIRKSNPSKLIVAVPVGSPRNTKKFENSNLVDELVCLQTPQQFTAVGQFYDNFNQVSDGEVVRLLQKNHEERALEDV